MSLFFLRGWILVSAWASLTGWSLGLIGHLNTKGYLASLAALVVALIFLFLKRPFSCKFRGSYVRLLFARSNKRFFRLQGFLFWFPSLFAFIALLTLVGGILYPPSNYDALSYRFPRILHWLESSGWHWIETPNSRQNYSAAGFEWLTIPLFVFFKTDRFFFLINWVCFLLLPGLVFRTFRLAGIPQKTCWHWMWILPLGYGFVLQAGGIANDAYATVYALASVCFALSADRKNRFSDFAWGLLSVGLLTGTKGSNLPLAFPWFVAMLLRQNVWIPRCLKLTPWVVIGLIVSFAPTAFLNHQHTGSWTGDSSNQGKMSLSNPIAGLTGNTLMLLNNALQPPLLTSFSTVNNFTLGLFPLQLKAWLLNQFPRFEIKMGGIPMEESAGLGLGLTSCVLLWICLSKRIPRPVAILPSHSWFFLGLAGICSLFFYMAKMGSESTGRLLLPYYPFLFFLPLGFWRMPFHLTAKIRWIFLFLASWAIVPLVLSPARPLFPVEKLLSSAPSNFRFSRPGLVYDTYSQRSNCFASLLEMLPPRIETLGFFSHEDDLEAPLWRPFGSRKIQGLDENFGTLDQLPATQAWLARRSVAERLMLPPASSLHWKEAGSKSITQKVSVGAEDWVLFLQR